MIWNAIAPIMTSLQCVVSRYAPHGCLTLFSTLKNVGLNSTFGPKLWRIWFEITKFSKLKKVGSKFYNFEKKIRGWILQWVEKSGVYIPRRLPTNLTSYTWDAPSRVVSSPPASGNANLSVRSRFIWDSQCLCISDMENICRIYAFGHSWVVTPLNPS